MNSHARYVVVADTVVGSEPLVIQDVGPWDEHPTVKDDAEHVVAELLRSGKLQPGQRLFYMDSDGRRDELVIKDGRFIGFAPGRTVAP